MENDIKCKILCIDFNNYTQANMKNNTEFHDNILRFNK